MARRAKPAWKGLDKDLRQQTMIERAGQHANRPLLTGGLALVFLVLCALLGLALAGWGEGAMVAAGAVFAGYMALNVGANDIGNNMGPVMGARAASLWVVLPLAALAELAGAVLAGRAVVETIGFGLIEPETGAAPGQIAQVMLAGLIAAGLWTNLATLLSASISTTHSVAGGIVGAGIATFGADAVDWLALSRITAAWILSPLAGGLLAAGLLALIVRQVMEAPDRRAAALAWVPRLEGALAGSFMLYLLLGGLPAGMPLPLPAALAVGAAAAGMAGLAGAAHCRRLVARWPAGAPPGDRALRGLFGLPLLVAALLFSFAHGANDVSNAAGPLAAILSDTGATRGAATGVLAIGGLGIALGVLLFGPRLIRVVGSEITKLNPIRAFCVLLSAAIIASAASWAGLPVSSTHIALGGIFGIGLWREAREARLARAQGGLRGAGPPPEERSRRRLVRRSLIFTMIGAWTITLPIAALLGAGIALGLDRLF